MSGSSLEVGHLRPKSTPTAVRGKIIVTTESGIKVSHWGGTECYLSWQAALGPSLVVRSSRHRKGDGTFFRLKDVHQVLSSYLSEGKLTIAVPHGQYKLCSVLIQADPADVEALFDMVSVITDKTQWGTLERNAGTKKPRRPIDDVTAMVGESSGGEHASSEGYDAPHAPTGRGGSAKSLIHSDPHSASDDDDDDQGREAVGVEEIDESSGGLLPWEFPRRKRQRQEK